MLKGNRIIIIITSQQKPVSDHICYPLHCLNCVSDACFAFLLFQMGYGEYYCWIGSQVGSLIFLAIPMAAVIATNIVLYAMTVASISHVSNSVPGQRHNARKDLMLYVRIFCVLGFTWMFGLLTLLVD